MQSELYISAIMAVMLVLAVCVPLIPAVVIYRLFPDTRVGLAGPLQGLTLRTSGAFAAYVITFLMALPLTTKMYNMVGGFYKPAWAVDAEIVVYNKDGTKVKSQELLRHIKVFLTPQLHRVGTKSVRIRIPGLKPEEWPHLTAHIPEWGSGEVNLAQLEGDIERNEFDKVIKINTPITIREYAGADTSYDKNQPYLNQ